MSATRPPRLRRDPRRDRGLQSRPDGRLRVLRGEGAAAAGSAGAGVAVAEAVSPARERVRTIEQPAYLILVVPDAIDGRLSAQDRDLIGLGRAMADAQGGAVCVATFTAPLDDLGLAGADRVVDLGSMDGAPYVPERQAAMLQAFIEREHPRHVLFPESHWGGGDLGRRLAALTGSAVATSTWRADLAAASRRAGGGTREVTMAAPLILLVEADVGEAVAGERFEARSMAAPAAADVAARVVDHGLRPFDPQSVALEEAEFILAAGNGVSDWAAFHALADALGASEGGSRVVVDAGALPRHRQVGATGASTTARCYIALGISGAPQHLQGISACEHVIAVNTDPNCDMMKRASLAVVADAQAVMHALLELCKAGGD
jgi:electron transfer flavoprotein alpha subunit